MTPPNSGADSGITVTRIGAGVFIIDGFLLPQECEHYIALSEKVGFSEAVISTDEGDQLLKDARNNDRILYDNRALAESLFSRAASVDRWLDCERLQRALPVLPLHQRTVLQMASGRNPSPVLP